MDKTSRVLLIVGGIATVVTVLHRSFMARLQLASHNARALFDIVVDKYLDRRFEATEAPQIGDEIVELRALKQRAKDELGEDKTKWELWPPQVKEPGTWQNKLAYELSIALERLGIAVVIGIVPLQTLLPLAAEQILDDWCLCKAWVDLKRRNGTVSNLDALPFLRRHAELLAFVTAEWMVHTNYGTSKSLRVMEGIYRREGVDIERRLAFLFKEEWRNLGPALRREIMALLGMIWLVTWPASYLPTAPKRLMSNAKHRTG